MESTNNPYQTPEGQLTSEEQGVGEIRFFSTDCRIGRLRYLAHAFLAYVLFGIVAGIGAAMAAAVHPIFWVVAAVGYIAILVSLVIFIIQRLHDLNHNGWLSLLMFVPLVNLLFGLYITFAAGTKGTNNYGLQPPPNKIWHWIAGLAFPIIFTVGMMAAIALPAYQQYIERAKAAQESSYQSGEMYEETYEDLGNEGSGSEDSGEYQYTEE